MNSVKYIQSEIPPNIFPVIVIPFFLFLYFLLFPKRIFQDSHSILGRLIAVVIIIYYTTIHVLYGVLVCVLLLLYYQTNIETFRPDTENILPIQMIETPSEKNSVPSIPIPTIPIPIPVDIQSDKMIPPKRSDTFFKNCKSDKLMYRNLEVKHSEMIPQLFPEVSFETTPCNPCNPTCLFTAKMKTEEELAPKSTHEPNSLTYLMEWTETFLHGKSEPYIGVKTINASYI